MKRNNLEYYDLHSDQWWKEGETLHLSEYMNKARFEFFSNYISDWQGVRVLDIGCGGGLACEFLAQQGAIVSGIDLSVNSIHVAREHAQQNHLQIEYRAGIAEELPYKDETFDVVMSFDVLEHVYDWQKVISEVYRVLNNQGLFLFDTINKTWKSQFIMIWLLEDILKQIPPGFHDWQKFIKPEFMLDKMHDIGFKDTIIKGFDLTGNMSLKTLQNLFTRGLNSSRKSTKKNIFEIQINDDTSVWYIGKAAKLN